MAIQNDWFVDYQHKLVVHATTSVNYDAKSSNFHIGSTVSSGSGTALIVNDVNNLPYDNLSGEFTVGATITQAGSGATAVIVSDSGSVLGLVSITGTLADDGEITDGTATADANIPSGITTGSLDLVYLTGTFSDNDTLTDNFPETGEEGSATQSSASSTKTNVYTARALYSFIQNTFDELGQMDDTVPMSAQTPTEFTMINGWFIDDESTKYLSGGAIATSGYNSEIRVLSFLSANYTQAVITDIGKGITQAGTGDTGTLLHYNNTTRKWWIRMIAADDVFDGVTPTTNQVTVNSGTGVGDLSIASTTGEDLYANIYTLGTIAIDPKPKTYVFQNGSALLEWWGRGDSAAHIDVLIKVKEAGAEIDGAQITVFVRNFGDLYDHFPIDLTSGGRNAVPLATATDLNNNVSGEIRLTYAVGGTDSWSVGQFVRDETSSAYGEILAVDTSNRYLYVGNVILGSGDFDTGHAIYESTTGLANDGTASAPSVSAVTPVVRGYNDIKVLFANVTISFTAGSVEPTVGAVITGGGSGATAQYIQSTLASGSWGSGNAVGTMYLANWDSTTFTASESITWSGGSASVGNPTNQTVNAEVEKRFEQGTLYPYNVVVFCANRTMAQVYEWFKYVTREDANSTQPSYQTMFRVAGTAIVEEDGEEYIAAQIAYSPVKQSPFGTFAGGKLFAAQGVWVEGMATSDRQNFQLIDADGNTRTPPNFITITVSSVVSGDKVTVFRTSSGTSINKSQFTLALQAAGDNELDDTSVVVSGAIPSDTPNSGHLRVVDSTDTSINRERRYAYSSWTNASVSGPGVFTLSGTGGTQVTLDRTYSAGEDTAYVPYYDEIAGNTSVYVTVIYSTDRTVLTRVRRYGGAGNSILPFEISGDIRSTGYSVAAIRTSDNIVT